MYQAGNIIRRSSVKLRSLSGNHGSLQMIISQIQEVRRTFKAFSAAQQALSTDLVKWSTTLDSSAMQHCFMNLNEINNMWSDSQNDFAESLKHLRHNFALILEGDQHVDQARQVYSSKEEAEKSLRKELQKSYKKSAPEEIEFLREKLSRVVKTKELAHLDVMERTRENEAVKLIRVKEGMLKIGRAHLQMAHKSSILYKCHQRIASKMPDVHDKAIHNVKYDSRSCNQLVEEAKERIRVYSSNHSPSTSSRQYQDPPPPYSPSRENLTDGGSCHPNINDLSRNMSGTSLTDFNSPGSLNLSPTNSYPSPSAPFDANLDFSTSSPISGNIYPDIPSEDALGAVGGRLDHVQSSPGLNRTAVELRDRRKSFRLKNINRRICKSLDGTSNAFSKLVNRRSSSERSYGHSNVESQDDSDGVTSNTVAYFR